MTIAAGSLFDSPAEPVVGGASAWIQGVIGGSVATSLCVIAVAILGLMLLAGRLQVRRGVEVVVGCFLLLGAGLLAAQLQLVGSPAGSGTAGGQTIIVPRPTPPQALPPANYDPYAGASLRRD